MDVQGDLRALIQDARTHQPAAVAERLNRAWAQDGVRRLREYVGGGPMTRYLTARSGQARDAVRAQSSAAGAQLSVTGPGMTFLEDGGTILPKRGQYLTFRLHQPWDGAEPTGRWIRTRRVTLPARHMVRDAGNQATDMLPTFLNFMEA